MTKKVFIFSASTGAGHNLAARSLAEALQGRGYDAQVYDAFKESSAALNRIVTKGYKQLVEIAPKLYEQMYHQFNKMTPFQQNIFKVMSKVMNPEIVPLIEKERPDLIISTHPFVTNMLGTLKAHGAFNQPVLSFVTDYKIHSVYLHPMIDAYVVGSEYTKQTMVERGVSPDIIYPFGIPIRTEFMDAPSAGSEKGDPAVRGTIMVMGGSMGARQMEKAFVSLMKTKEKIRIIVVCGNNAKVERDIRFLAKVYEPADKVVEIHGFVQNVSQLMDQSEAIITKPGGLTSTEAMVKGIPMIIPYYYPGQEEENTDFLVDSGMAIKVDKVKDLTSLVDFLIENSYIIREMSANMTEEARRHSMEKTLDLCRQLMD
ncbi:MGDG synthase family glycosyltransferase [Eubacterium barkeri]|uniref:Processive 1,2-diacylglycerol beta-glucosyltransferase n=1 Tax=Eubacterium barkeri TaxID=1528 RepID=A0A1H3HVA4_EUBBA|nr:glycosyltransferase [Eubacterium barkeri]SDY18684.1 processive 1,2-diacylglycerol beta-glucosyltransferase [Eubacterium barkeri]